MAKTITLKPVEPGLLPLWDSVPKWRCDHQKDMQTTPIVIHGENVLLCDKCRDALAHGATDFAFTKIVRAGQ